MISKYLAEVGAHALPRGAFAQPVATGERRSSSPCQAPSLGTSFEKEVPTKKTRMKIKMEVNSILIFDYNIKVNSDFSFGLWQISFGRYSGLESRPDGNRRRPGRHSY